MKFGLNSSMSEAVFLYRHLARVPFTERVFENREDSHWGALVVVKITFSLHSLCVLSFLYQFVLTNNGDIPLR
jgi:hypothetical protein